MKFNFTISRFHSRKRFLLFIMRLFLILFCTTILSFTPNNTFSQEKVFVNHDQLVTVQQVFRIIKKQTKYGFIFPKNMFQNLPKIQLVKGEIELSTLLNQSLNSKKVKFEVSNDDMTIIIKNKIIEDQQLQVTGKVTDDTGAPLPGVNIIIKGTSTGVTSDFDGKYVIGVKNGDVLVFSYIGMVGMEIPFDNQSNIDVILKYNTSELDEVILVGFGKQKKTDLTGSVARADIEAFREAPNVNLLQSLQGTVPGLNIGITDSASDNPSLSIRGRTSINGVSSTLIVLDGIIYNSPLSSLNPSDIKSIDVLKDASSMAVYGAQAANGVILITTKKGKKTGKPVINYSTSYSTANPAYELPLMNRDQFLKKARDVFWEEAYTQASGYTEINPNYNMEDGVISPENIEGLINGTDTNWYDIATNAGHVQKHNVSISGANDNSSYFVSAGFDKQKNWIINDNFSRKSVRLNFDTQINDWLKISTQTYGAVRNFSGSSPELTRLVLSGPLRSPYDANDELNINFQSIRNPIIDTFRDDLDKRNSLFANFSAIVNPSFVPGLSYTINFGNDIAWNNEYYSDTFSRSETGEVYKRNSSTYSYTLDNIINYVKEINDNHKINVTLLAGIKERNFEDTEALGYGFSNQKLGYNSIEQAQNQEIESDSWEEASSYQMARVNYTLNNKYLITTTIRRDGFSGFAANKKIATFPSLALAWKLSEEEFMSNITWLNNLKLRGGWGKNGNLISRYASLSQVNSGPAYVFGDGGGTRFGQSTQNMTSPNLGWESTSGINLGLDFSILNGRVNGNVEYYNTATTDLLWNFAVPRITGFDSLLGNLGEVENTGLEFTLNITPVRTTNFKWDLAFNFSTNKNKVTELLGRDNDGDGIEDDLITSELFIGEPLSTVYSYEIDGIYQIEDNIPPGYLVGSYIVKDNNDDGLRNSDDRVILGNTDPAYRFSIQNTLKYKNLTLRLFVNSIQGGKNGYLGAIDPWNHGGLGNAGNNAKHGTTAGAGLDYWSPSNPGAYFRGAGTSSAINPLRRESRNFVRLQDISLSYNFDKDLINSFGLQDLKLFLSGKNLHTWTKWKGWDPETGGGLGVNGRPVIKNIGLGLNITF